MSTYGVTSAGFEAKPLAVCKSELEQLIRAAFGDATNVEPESPWGQLLGILAEREADLWDMAQEVHASRDPDQATGSALDAVCAITGTVREPAKKSSAYVVLAGTSGTVVPSGSVASVSGTGIRFSTATNGTIVAATAWVPSTSYEVGDRRTNAGNLYEAITAGISAAAGGPTGTGTDIIDGGAHWKWIIEGASFVEVQVEADETGPNVAPAGTLTVIETPVSGWTAVTNALDATIGADLETDAALRIRRKDELMVVGSATIDAIRAEVLRLEDVTACTVFENTTDAVLDGMPPKSVEALVTGGDDADVADAIWRSRSAGIETHGGEVVQLTDSQSVSRTIKFSRPAPVDVHVKVILKKDPLRYPSDGDSQVKAALVAYGTEKLGVGVDVVTRALIPSILGISGVMDVPSVLVRTAPDPQSEANIGIAGREQAILDTSRIVVDATDFVDVP